MGWGEKRREEQPQTKSLATDAPLLAASHLPQPLLCLLCPLHHTPPVPHSPRSPLNPQRYRPHFPTPTSPAYTSHPLPILLALKHASLHGATKSLEESRTWMIEHMTQYDNWFYAVFERTCPSDDNSDNDNEAEEEGKGEAGLGTHLGSISLRRCPSGPELLPQLPKALEAAEEVGSGPVVDATESAARALALQEYVLDSRVLGYAFFAAAHGKGYATEAARALLAAYGEKVREWRAAGGGGCIEGGGEGREVDAGMDLDKERRLWYVEAGVDVENPGSQRVLRKVGFRTVGMKVQEGKAWLNGGWRGPGWWITGLYL